MKTVFYNSKIAEFFTPLSGFKTVMLFGFVFTEKSALSDSVIAHERVHQQQYAECLAAGLALASLCFILLPRCPWLWIIPFVVYYILYLAEYSVHLIRFRNTDKAYYAISFEQEAYDLMYEYSKPEEARRQRQPFGWRHYFTSQNDQTP
jgi:hypothetical protein